MHFSSHRHFLFPSDGIFPPRVPVTLHVTAHLVSLVGRVPVEAAVRTLRVVEQDGTFDRCSHLLQAGKRPSMKELVLDGIVDALGHRVVLRVATLGHAWRNVIQSQLLYVLRAGVLGAAVGVVDERVGKAFGQCGHGSPQCLYAVFSLKRRGHAAAQDTFAVGIHDERQEAETVAQTGPLVLYRHIGYVTDPYLVGACRDHVLHEVRIGRQVVPRVGRSGSPEALHHIKPALMQDASENVSTHAVLLAETGLVHAPELVGSDSRVLSPDLTHELDNELLYRKLAEQEAVVALVKGLPCHTGQRTKLTHRVPGLPFVQPSDCPVTAFFRISMPNISSATSTIVS